MAIFISTWIPDVVPYLGYVAGEADSPNLGSWAESNKNCDAIAIRGDIEALDHLLSASAALSSIFKHTTF